MIFEYLKKTSFQDHYKFIFLICLLSLLTFSVQAQEIKSENIDLSDFLITIEFEDDVTGKLNCNKGCAWNELGFHHNVNDVQTINFNGMVHSSEDNISDEFSINIQREEEQIVLSCERGCAWKSLKFRIPANGQKQTFDAYGVVTSGGY